MTADADLYDIIIRDVHVFDGQSVLAGPRHVGLNGHEIAAVSSTPLKGRQEIDGEGYWLMPGLIDTHIHFYDFRVVRDPLSLQAFVAHEVQPLLNHFLESGVTTVKSVGDPTTEILETRAAIAAGTLRGPRLLTTGNGLTGRDGHPASTIFGGNPWFRARATGEVDSPQMMRDIVHHLADRKVDAIKLLSEGGCTCQSASKYIWQNPVFPNAVELVRLPKSILRAGIEAAHERNLRVTVHTVQQDAAIEAIEAGADGLEHGVTVEPITDKALIDMMVERRATYASTLWIHDAVHPHTRPNTRLMAEAGVAMVLGSDSFCGRGQFGQNTLEEAELMEASGLSPSTVLTAATSTAAWHLGRSDMGTVAPGKQADLILLKADPTKTVGNLRHLAMTILKGEIVVDRR
jgi:imidazolonepropionase-like amidohydrolase